ncbi:MAG: hypothetical protein AVDCRST_MAG68-3032 [uncultured Gemmatimonadetes bacterium]|uniref:TonB-dependent receptor plug domain-containing protein n=1 Tax=uncultured Gemmatimonadota bacterium TaxID=203437 RepID=A0A6J4LSU6_9BACT|nr:MAG: hypothetical protein AVDCRST_MAG68-3032 [uncultured Gemmatimonadota bacterium]
MSAHLLRTAAAAAFLSLAALGEARAQEAFASNDAGAALSGASEAPEVLKVDARAGNAYQVVAKSNAAWLASRGPHEFPERAHVVVYLDGLPIGGKQALRGLQASSIAEIRRLSPLEATRQLGVEHGAGAILVTSK